MIQMKYSNGTKLKPLMHDLPGDSLGVGLFQEGAPELMSIWGVEVNQLVVHSGQQVVDPHLLPLAVLPELATGGDRGSSGSAQNTQRMQQILVFVGNRLWRWSSRCIPPGSSVLEAPPSPAGSDSQRETQWRKATSSRLKKLGVKYRQLRTSEEDPFM